MYGQSIINYGIISSDGSKAGCNHSYAWFGGGSGAGSINLFYDKNYSSTGNITVVGTGNYTDKDIGGTGTISVGSISTGTYVSTYTNY